MNRQRSTFNIPFSTFMFSALMVLLLASCRSAKHAKEDVSKPPAPIVVTKPSVMPVQPGTPAFTPTEQNFTAKVKVRLAMGNDDIATSGALRMRWNDVIQLTLVDPIFGVTEVGRMELSPDNLLIIDRINKRYVRAAYDQISAFRDRGIDFAQIQSMFWSEATNSNEFSIPIPLSKPIQLDLRLSDKGHSEKWESHATVSSKYVQVDAERLLRSMMQLSE